MLIASAVAASCTACGIMQPRALLQKHPRDGEISAFHLIEAADCEGSFEAGLPKDQLRSAFQVNQFIVSQVPCRIGLRTGPGTSVQTAVMLCTSWSSEHFCKKG